MTRKPCILFQTDFGVGGGVSLYGMCRLVDPALRACELSHTIPTFDVAEASRRLARTLPYWPTGTHFVSVVDPGVGTPRRACVALTENGYYITTPDNGTLTDVHRLYGIRAIREIDERINRYPHTSKVSIFHGRDLFAYCAARLAAGVIDFAQVGPAYPVSDIIRENFEPCPLPDYTQAEAAIRQAGAARAPSFIVLINDFFHDGQAALLRGICECAYPGVDVYDLPVTPEEMKNAAALAEDIRAFWPADTLFILAGRDGAGVSLPEYK